MHFNFPKTLDFAFVIVHLIYQQLSIHICSVFTLYAGFLSDNVTHLVQCLLYIISAHSDSKPSLIMSYTLTVFSFEL